MKKQEREKTRRENLAKVYFKYWRLQNNPDYLEFWRELSGMDEKARRSKFVSDGNKDEIKNWLISRCADFELIEPVDPTFQINWNTIFNEKTDHSFMARFYKAWKTRGLVQIYLGTPKEPPKDFFTVFVNYTADKKDFMKAMTKAFDYYRTAVKFKIRNREHWIKVPLYCQAWETVMSAPPKTFDDAKLILKTNKITIYKRLRRAFELLTGKSYTPEGRREILIKKMEEFDRTLILCNKCEDKICERTKIMCQKMDDYLKRNFETSFVGKTMEHFDAYSDNQVFKDWQETKN